MAASRGGLSQLSAGSYFMDRRRWGQQLFALSLAVALGGCGFNEVVDADESVKAEWAEVQNQYTRRADLVPNLVNAVKGAANFEKDTLVQVVEARAKVGSVRIDAQTSADPERMRAFEGAQQQLSGALSRLLVVAERYPEIKATEQFRDLQAQLEGTENRIAVARRRFIEAVAAYNKVVLRFPTLIGARIRGMAARPTFEGTPGQDKPPTVQF